VAGPARITGLVAATGGAQADHAARGLPRHALRRAGQHRPLGRVRVSDGGSLDIGDDVEIGASTMLIAEGGVITLGRHCHVGAGAVVIARERIAIGDDCVVGANAVVTRDLDPGTLAVGVPARPVRRVR
jgi:acetyltransferase-like isoleucine patch superfamily enzyme